MTKLQRLIWLVQYLERHRIITYATYVAYHPTLSRRTYCRDVAILKAAGGVILQFHNTMRRGSCDSRDIHGVEYIRFNYKMPIEHVNREQKGAA